MPIGKLSPLQERVLLNLADIEPRWTLTGGGALAGFHTHHRETRALDLFFRQQTSLGSVVAAVREQLERDGLQVAVLRTSSMFSQLDVRDASSSVVVDLVAAPPRSLNRLELSRWARRQSSSTHRTNSS